MQVFVLEAVQAVDDSPIMGKILAFVGESHAQVLSFIDANRDFVITADEKDSDSWHWRESEMTVGSADSSFFVTREFGQDGKEK